MKKIFTLLFSVGLAGAVMAQNGGHGQNHNNGTANQGGSYSGTNNGGNGYPQSGNYSGSNEKTNTYPRNNNGYNGDAQQHNAGYDKGGYQQDNYGGRGNERDFGRNDRDHDRSPYGHDGYWNIDRYSHRRFWVEVRENRFDRHDRHERYDAGKENRQVLTKNRRWYLTVARK